MTTVLLLLTIASIIAHAKANAVIYWKKRVSHTWEAVMLLCLLIIIVFGSWINAASYVLLRAGLFNPIYALMIKQEYTFLGTTHWYDRLLQPLLKLENRKDIPVIKGFPAYSVYLMFCFAIGLFINYMRYIYF